MTDFLQNHSFGLNLIFLPHGLKRGQFRTGENNLASQCAGIGH